VVVVGSVAVVQSWPQGLAVSQTLRFMRHDSSMIGRVHIQHEFNRIPGSLNQYKKQTIYF